VNVADVEKTLADCTAHPELCGGIRELVQAIVVAEDRDYSWATVDECLQRLENGAATKRVVYLSDQLGIDLPARETLFESFTSGYPLLDPTRSEQRNYDNEYRLRINVDRERLDSMES
jgi:predicted transcriptional regulator of viral defense system